MVNLSGVIMSLEQIARELEDPARRNRVSEEKYGQQIQQLAMELEGIGRRLRYGRT
jgi:hypothetical protein